MEKITFVDNVTKANADTFNTMQDNIENAINEIVESGSNANGNYIKYNDGTMICYKEVSSSVAFDTTWGSLKEGSLELGNYAQEFITKPNVQITNISGVGAIIESFSPEPTKTSIGKLYVVRPTTYTGTVKIAVLATGRWK